MKKNFFSLAGTWLAFALTAQPVGAQELSVWFDTPNNLDGRAVWLPDNTGGTRSDPAWESRSLPLGNGSLGANVMGSVAAERITLNEKTLWKGGPNTAKGAAYYWNVNKESAGVLGDIRQAFLEGDREKAAALTREHFNGLAAYNESDETPFRFGSFTTMGELYVETGLSEVGMTDYRRSLSLDSATVTVQFRKDGVHYRRQYFISRPDSVMVMRFTADVAGRQHLVLSYCPNNEADGDIREDGSGGWLYTGKLRNNGMRFALRIKAVCQGGTVRVEGNRILVQGADEAVFFLAAATDYRMNFQPDFTDPLTYVGNDPVQTTRVVERALQKGYSELLRRHEADYTALFDRVRLQLNPQQTSPDLPTDKRLARYRKGAPDYALEQLYFQYGRYLLIASSRPGTMPANLQGLWHNNTDGPWHMDYHNNINVQMNYWPACSTNLAECARPLIDFIRTLEKPGERTAQAYFNARGWTASISANIFGFTAPLSDKDMSWNLIPVAGPWLATHVWDYYDYTRDLRFLKDVGYGLIRGSARFAVDHLWHKPDGSYTAAPSTSPEHGPVDEGTTFAHAVVREVLLDAIEASKVLKTDARERKQWEEVLAKLPPYRIGRYGQLMEWSTDIDDPNDQHRHVNHLFGLHPGRTITPIGTPQLAQAAKVVLEHRGDGATGWSMGWKLNQWARLQDGNHAYTLFANLLKNGTLDNLWDTHPPFQIDGNFGGTAGIAEMLMQSHAGCIQLLPALPDAWKEGSVSGLCARGNFEVSEVWKDGRLVSATLLSKAGAPCTVRYKDHVLNFRTQKGGCYQIRFKNGVLEVEK